MKSIKILLVDDIEINRVLLKQMLESMGAYKVIQAVDGKDALAIFIEEKPDLILMDINMPEMDGYQSAAAIKDNSGEDYTPIIFVTALSTESSLPHALSSGGDDFISKPFTSDVLESKINVHLRIRKLNQELNNKNSQLVKLNQRLVHEQDLIEHFFVNALQKSFLDKDIIKYHMSSASAFNGDLLLVERGPCGGMYLVMGDFSGHGLSASMGTLPVALIFFNMVSEGAAVGNIAREINSQLNKLMPPGMFFAASLLEINASGDILSVWMGGMPEVYWLDSNGKLKGSFHSQHMPLGILEDNEFDNSTNIINVENGDKIYLYSDGVTESISPEGEIFGDGRLKEILIRKGRNQFDNVLDELKTFSGISNQKDDITFVEMTCSSIPAYEKNGENSVSEVCLLPWKISMSLTEREIRNQDPVSALSEIIGSIPFLSEHKGSIHVLLSEMYSNALEHSILKINSINKTDEEHFVDYYSGLEEKLSLLENASIDFDFTFFPDPGQQRLIIRIKDNGMGYKGHVNYNSEDMLHGHGLQIIKGLCENVTFHDNGNSMEVMYRLND